MILFSSHNKGFTLVEVMVSMAIFAFVMVVAVGAFIKVLDVNKRAQTVKAAVNNVSFTLEALTREMRTGSQYTSITNGVQFVAFEDSATGLPVRHAYRRNATTNTLQRAVGRPGAAIAESDYVTLTGTGVRITRFDVTIGNGSSSTEMPYALIRIAGEAGTIEKNKTTFETQTLVSQRLI